MTDTADLRAWARDLGQAAEDVVPEIRKVVEKGLLNIKNGARRAISGHPSAPYYPNAIDYDIRQSGDSVTGEVGPNKNRRQGALGNLLEFGSVNNAPIPHMGPATDKELPKLDKNLDAVVPELLE